MLVFLSAVLLTFAHAKTEYYDGVATKDGKMVYKEHHIVEVDDKGTALTATTEYTDPKGKMIAVLKSDFTKSLTSPDHVFEDLRSGKKYGLRRENGQVAMFRQEKGKDEDKLSVNEKDKKDRTLFGCQGLNYYLKENFDKLKLGQHLPIAILIPGNLDSYNFEINVNSMDENQIKLRIKIDNWFLRMFAPQLDITYEVKTGHLLYYKGLSNLMDDDGKNQSVEITYTYTAG